MRADRVIPSTGTDLRRRLVENVRRVAGAGREVVEADTAAVDFDSFGRLIARAAEVHANRLHTMVLAAMLGKPVVAHETRRPKLMPFYDYCLRGWARVTFAERGQ
ncbi:MAG: hypothetical protein HY303_04190 [Candidatus Wallbacteria bacterium]|nr:hypothetical protein [Candidatus Wallbacteria bacterium]